MGTVTDVDLREPIHRMKGLKPLRDKVFFSKVRKGEGGHSVMWPGEIDIGADWLWEIALQQSGREDALEFVRWHLGSRLSLTAAAEALGLSRRQMTSYLTGRHTVPRLVLLACKGWKAERESNKTRKRA